MYRDACLCTHRSQHGVLQSLRAGVAVSWAAQLVTWVLRSEFAPPDCNKHSYLLNASSPRPENPLRVSEAHLMVASFKKSLPLSTFHFAFPVASPVRGEVTFGSHQHCGTQFCTLFATPGSAFLCVEDSTHTCMCICVVTHVLSY